jgi:N-acetylmuramoyl-L-alanine amidase
MKKVATMIGSVLTAVLLWSSTAQAEENYTVKKGDTLWNIANAHEVSLDELRKTNNLYTNLIYPNQKLIIPTSSTISASSEEKDLLARLVRAEAEGEPYAGKVAVATVVLNRVDSPDFPNTVKEVIYQSGQFTPVDNGEINKTADSESKKAVEEAYGFRGQGAGSLFFYNSKTATSRWLDSKTTTIVIGNHTFKK